MSALLTLTLVVASTWAGSILALAIAWHFTGNE